MSVDKLVNRIGVNCLVVSTNIKIIEERVIALNLNESQVLRIAMCVRKLIDVANSIDSALNKMDELNKRGERHGR